MDNSKSQNAATYSFAQQEMIAVSRDEFVSGSMIPADVFLQLTEDKYVLLARQGAKASFADLHVAERAEASNFFVRKTDYKNCVGQNLSIAGIVVSRNEISDAKKADMLSKTADSVFKEINILGFNGEGLLHAKAVTDAIRTLVGSKNDLCSILDLMAGVPGNLVRHSMAVSAISIMIARGLDWVLPQTIEKLALGALLHDVGLKELPQELIQKPRHLMSFEDVSMYETHVFRGVEILRSMPSIPDDIIAIVFEHHENAIGQGYPRKLRDFRMNPLAKVVALAVAFADLTIKNPNNAHPKNAEQAINYIESTLGQPYNKKAFVALKSVLGLAPASSSVRRIA